MSKHTRPPPASPVLDKSCAEERKKIIKINLTYLDPDKVAAVLSTQSGATAVHSGGSIFLISMPADEVRDLIWPNAEVIDG